MHKEVSSKKDAQKYVQESMRNKSTRKKVSLKGYAQKGTFKKVCAKR